MRKKLIIITFLSCLVLTGCSKERDVMNELTEKYVMQESGIKENEDYQKYIELKNSGKLNENGEYNELGNAEYQASIEETEKQVHVTIAQNSLLKTDYFYDSGLTEKVEGDSIFMNPGDKLYCSQPKKESPNNNGYVFSKFQIFEFDGDGNRGDLWCETGENSLVLDIPEDFSGTELSVMPVGEYEKRDITFHAFYYDESGVSKNVPGAWLVDDELCADNMADVNAADSYTVKYQYDENTYYYVSANPSPFSTGVPGIVEFRKPTALSSDESYSVQLHKWITAVFYSDNKKGIASVEKNGEQIQDFDNKEVKGLKEGDKLVITTNGNYRLFCSGIVINEPEEVEGGFRYTVVIPKTNESEFTFMVSKSELQVTLDASVGYDMAFDIIAAGVHKNDCYYSKQWLNGETIIFDGTVGLEEKLTISIREADIEPGTVVKADITKTDGNNVAATEIKYISASPGSVQIDLYDDSGKIANPNKIYKKVAVKLSLVEVMEYTEPPKLSNAVIKVETIDGAARKLLKEGDIIEGNREVEVSINPESGYYVTGKGAAKDVYVKRMKLSAYESDIKAIIRSLEVKKLYSITLDDKDSYGTVIYKLNGKEEVGTVTVREEDKLILEYELTDDNYEIVRESDGFMGDLNDLRKNVFSKNRETRTIELSDAMNGTTIKRSDYINISEKTGEE